MEKTAKITFCGGTGSVTGSNFLLEVDGQTIVVDCGLLQGMKVADDVNWDPFLFDSKKDKKEKVEEILKQVYENIILDKKNGGTMTGAQIKNLSEAIISYAVSHKIKTLTVEVLKDVVEALNKDLKEVYDMADAESMSKDRMTPIGFEQTNMRKSYGSNELDWNTIMNPKINKQNNSSSF